jgi:predicted GNAT superfamily acetyltransferase
MVGVDPEFRGRGIGQALKLAQKQAVLAQGLDLMRWTFEPLAAENATLNLAKLGAEAVAYIPNLYGDATTSPLHQGLGTDRLLVEWRLAAPRRAPDARAPRISVPADLAALRRSPGEAAQVRARVRDEFKRAFESGLVAVDFKDGTYLFAKRAPS